MKLFFDTSVLVSAFQEADPRHPASLRALTEATNTHAYCGTHTLAETYSVLTRMPGKESVPCAHALFFLETALRRLTPISLTAEEYINAIEEMAAKNIGGGKTYDGLLLAAAHKAQADLLYTWNARDFSSLNTRSSLRIATPHA